MRKQNTETFPPYVNCALCPAQAYRVHQGIHYIFNNVNFLEGLHLEAYVCPSKHEVYIEGRENNPKREDV